MRNVLGAVLIACLFVEPTHAESAKAHAVATVIGLDGKELGAAEFSQTGRGVLIALDLHRLPPGMHAVHIHATGACDPKEHFASAGPHLSLDPQILTPRAHGYFARGGPDDGDLPNEFAAGDGTMRAATITNAFTLGNGGKSIFDRDGASIVIDARADDYSSQPAGNSGESIACGVIVRTVVPGARKGGSRAAHE
jgi:Cu-Zn family superoxide dismutase